MYSTSTTLLMQVLSFSTFFIPSAFIARPQVTSFLFHEYRKSFTGCYYTTIPAANPVRQKGWKGLPLVSPRYKQCPYRPTARWWSFLLYTRFNPFLPDCKTSFSRIFCIFLCYFLIFKT